MSSHIQYSKINFYYKKKNKKFYNIMQNTDYDNYEFVNIYPSIFPNKKIAKINTLCIVPFEVLNHIFSYLVSIKNIKSICSLFYEAAKNIPKKLYLHEINHIRCSDHNVYKCNVCMEDTFNVYTLYYSQIIKKFDAYLKIKTITFTNFIFIKPLYLHIDTLEHVSFIDCSNVVLKKCHNIKSINTSELLNTGGYKYRNHRNISIYENNLLSLTLGMNLINTKYSFKNLTTLVVNIDEQIYDLDFCLFPNLEKLYFKTFKQNSIYKIKSSHRNFDSLKNVKYLGVNFADEKIINYLIEKLKCLEILEFDFSAFKFNNCPINWIINISELQYITEFYNVSRYNFGQHLRKLKIFNNNQQNNITHIDSNNFENYKKTFRDKILYYACDYSIHINHYFVHYNVQDVAYLDSLDYYDYWTRDYDYY